MDSPQTIHSTLSQLLKRVSQLEDLVHGLVNYTNYSRLSSSLKEKYQDQRYEEKETGTTCTEPEPGEVLDDDEIILGGRKRRKLVCDQDQSSVIDDQEKHDDDDDDVIDIKHEFVLEHCNEDDKEHQSQKESEETEMISVDECSEQPIIQNSCTLFTPQLNLKSDKQDEEGQGHYSLQIINPNEEDSSGDSDSSSCSSDLQVTSAVFRKSTINYKGFEYHLETAGLNLKIWRCTARLGCTARLHTNDFIKEKNKPPQVLGEFGSHNHDGVGDKNKLSSKQVDGPSSSLELCQTNQNSSTQRSSSSLGKGEPTLCLTLPQVIPGFGSTHPKIIHRGYEYHFDKDIEYSARKLWRCQFHTHPQLKCLGRIHTNDFINDTSKRPELLMKLGHHKHLPLPFHPDATNFLHKSIPKKPKRIVMDVSSSELQLTKTRHGKTALVYKGAKFVCNGNDTGATKVYWSCQRRKSVKCRARLHTNDFEKNDQPPTLLLEMGCHNHELDPGFIPDKPGTEFEVPSSSQEGQEDVEQEEAEKILMDDSQVNAKNQQDSMKNVESNNDEEEDPLLFL